MPEHDDRAIPATRQVLVVDDDAIGRKLTEIRLRDAGFEVTTAGSAEEALDRLAMQVPDAILSDIRMPGMDGFAFGEAVRRDARLALTPFVLLSAVESPAEDRRRAAAFGARCCVRTPDMREAIEALRRLTSPVSPP